MFFDIDMMYIPLARMIMKKDIRQQYQAQRDDITAIHKDIERIRGNYRQLWVINLINYTI